MVKNELARLTQKFHSFSLPSFDRWFRKLSFVIIAVLLAAATAVMQAYQEKTYILIVLMAILVVVATRWGLLGLVVFLLIFSPFNWITVNIDKIPILGWILPNLPRVEKILIIFGGAYLFLLFFTKLKTIKQEQIIPYLLLSGILIFGLLDALFFAWFPGPNSIAMEWYLNTILVGVVIYYLVNSTIKNGKQFHMIIYAMIIPATLFACVTVIFPKVLILNYVADTDPNRLGGFFTLPFGFDMWANPVYISSYVGLAMIFVWGHLITEPITWKRIFWLATFILLTRVIILTNSRTGIYGAFFGIIFISGLVYLRRFIHPDHSTTKKHPIQWLGTAILIIICVGVILWQFSNYFSSLANPSDYIARILIPLINPQADPNAVGRVNLFLISLKANLSTPWGIGGQAIHTITGYNEHSFYTLLLSELGWGGLALFLSFSGWCIFKCISGFRYLHREGSFLAALVLCGITTVLVMGWGHTFIGTIWGVMLLWTLFALSASLPNLAR